jgi:hypothetical protein
VASPRPHWRSPLQALLVCLVFLLPLVEARYRISNAAHAFDFPFFFDAAQRLVDGKDVYQAGSGYYNGPALALALSPLTALGPAVAAQVWMSLSWALLLVLATALWYHLGSAGPLPLAMIAVLLYVSLPTRHTFDLGQVTILAALTGIGTWFLAQRESHSALIGAATCLWITVELKPHYAWLLVLLLLSQRRFRVVAAVVGIVIAENLLLALWNPSATWWSWIPALYGNRGSTVEQAEQSTVGRYLVRYMDMPASLSLPMTLTALVVVLSSTVWISRRMPGRSPTTRMTLAALWMAAVPFASAFSHPQDWLLNSAALVVCLGASRDPRFRWCAVILLSLLVLPNSSNLHVQWEVPTVLLLLTSLAALLIWPGIEPRMLVAGLTVGCLAIGIASFLPTTIDRPIVAPFGLLTWMLVAGVHVTETRRESTFVESTCDLAPPVDLDPQRVITLGSPDSQLERS